MNQYCISLYWKQCRQKSGLEKHDFQHYFSCWTGGKALSELEDANVSLKSFPILQECATKAIKAASDVEPGLLSSFSFFFSENGIHASDYLLAVQRYVKKIGILQWRQTSAPAHSKITIVVEFGTLCNNTSDWELGRGRFATHNGAKIHWGCSCKSHEKIEAPNDLTSYSQNYYT